MVKKRKFYRRKKGLPTSLAEIIFILLDKMSGGIARSRLTGLWENWPCIMGEELAAIAEPLGHKGRTLILRADNAIQMQELYFLVDDVRTKANAFLNEDYFEQVRIDLTEDGKNCLSVKSEGAQRRSKEQMKLHLPTVSGKFLGKMRRDSPVARCYARFAQKKI